MVPTRRARDLALLFLLCLTDVLFSAASPSDGANLPGSELGGVWMELPRAHVALGGDVRGSLRGQLRTRAPHLRLKRDDDDGPALLATLPLQLDLDSTFTIPCGYFSRGGIYYVELVDTEDASEHAIRTKSGEGISLLNTDEDTNDPRGSTSLDIKERTDSSLVSETVNVNGEGFITNNKDNLDVRRQASSSVGDVSKVNEFVTSTDDVSATRSWRFEVAWPAARLAVTPEHVQTYPEQPVTALLEFPGAACAPLGSSADFWLELLYCGHASGGAVLCDGRNISSHAHVLYSEQIHGFSGRRTLTLRCELFGQAGDYALTLRPAAAAPPADYAAAFLKADWSEQFVLNVQGRSVFPCGAGGVRALFQYPACVLERADRVRVFGREPRARLRYVAERRVRRGQHAAAFDCALFTEKYAEYCFVYVSQAVTGAVADVRMDCVPTLPMSESDGGSWGAWSEWSACPPGPGCARATRSRHRFCDSPPPRYGAKYCEGRAVELSWCACGVNGVRGWRGADSPRVLAEVGPGCRCGCVLHVTRAPRLLAGSTRACPGRTFWLIQSEPGTAIRLRMSEAHLPCGAAYLRARAGDSLAAPLIASWPNDDEPQYIRADSTEDEELTEENQSSAVEVTSGRFLLLELFADEAGAAERCAGGFIAHAHMIDAPHNASAIMAAAAAPTAERRGAGARLTALGLAAGAAAAALALAVHSAARTRHYRRAADKESLTDSDACSASLELVSQTGRGSRTTLFSEVSLGAAAGPLRRLLGRRRTGHRRLHDTDLAIEDDEEEADGKDEREEDAASIVSTHTVAEAGGPCDTLKACGGTLSAPCTPTPSVTPGASPLRRSRTAVVSGAGGNTGREKDGASPARVITQPSTTNVAASVVSGSSAIGDLSTSFSSASEREIDSISEKDRDSVAEKDNNRGVMSAMSSCSRTSSAATLTNGCYSPALSGVSRARVRGTESKRHKERHNRRRLLRASDLSLSHQEMELDYYDYEVNNAGSVPGSYLGMDPAFLVWIPPLDEGDIIQEIDEKGNNIYEEILPREHYPDPGSNTESPESDTPAKHKVESNNTHNVEISKKRESPKLPGKVVNKTNIIHPLNFSISDLQNSPKLSRRNSAKNNSDQSISIPLKDLSLKKSKLRSPVRVHKRIADKEVGTLKANASLRNVDSDLGDIKFADDNSDSSNELRYPDGVVVTDSNKIADKLNVKI